MQGDTVAQARCNAPRNPAPPHKLCPAIILILRNFMRYPLPKSIIACLLLVACAQASAGSFSDGLDEFRRVMAEGKASTSADIDNDSLLLKKDDGFYTSGMRIRREFTLRDADKATTVGWRIGQEQYTASDIKLPPELVGPPDHPYAAWLYGGVYNETHRVDGSHLRLGLDFGC